MIIIPGLRGFSFTVGSTEKNPRRVTFMRFHLRETAFVSFKVKVEGEGEQRMFDSCSGCPNEALLEKEKQQMTPAQVLLTAAIAVAVGFWGGFDLGYTLGHDAGKRGAR